MKFDEPKKNKYLKGDVRGKAGFNCRHYCNSCTKNRVRTSTCKGFFMDPPLCEHLETSTAPVRRPPLYALLSMESYGYMNEGIIM